MTVSLAVITCVYNGEAFVGEYWIGIKKLGDLVSEIVIVNDGSTDATREKLGELSDGRLKVIHQANLGLPASRNVGLGMTSSDYVIFLDIDDCLNEFGLRRIKSLLEKEDHDVVVANVKYVGDDNAGLRRLNWLRKFALPKRGNISRKIFFNNFLVTPSCLVIKSSYAKRHKFRPELTIGEDWEFFTRVLDTTSLTVKNYPLVHYLIVEGSMSSTALKDRTKVRLLMKYLAENYINSNGPQASLYARHVEVMISLFELKRANYPLALAELIPVHWGLILKSPRSIGYVVISLFRFALFKVI